MSSFGARLRTEREGRGLTIQAVAETLGVDRESLLALERDDYGALSDQPVMIRCLHAYADCLEVDAELMIEDYRQEREEYFASQAGSLPDRATETAPDLTTAREDRPHFLPRLVVAFLFTLLVGAAGALWLLSGDDVGPPARTAVERPAESPAPPTGIDSGHRAESPAPLVAIEPAPPAKPLAKATLPAPAMRIGEYGVGTAVKGRKLVGESDDFAEGTQVWFWTRVEAGEAGGRIEHVWLQGGREAARITLEIGGSPWRTYSAKMLHRGTTGPWAVEARDPEGNVLARSEFSCVR